MFKFPGLWQRMLPALQPIAAILLAVVVWEGTVRVFDVAPYVFPAATVVFQEGMNDAPTIGIHYLVTLQESILGFLLAAGIGIPLAALVALSRPAERALYPGMALADMIPKVSLAPIYIVWLGLGLVTKLVIAVQISFFPIVLNGILGFRSIGPEMIYLSQSTGANPWLTFWKIRFPNALPCLFVGLKYGASAAMAGAIVGEFIGGNAGLGYYMLLVLGNFRLALGMAVILVTTTIGLGLFFLVQTIERFAIPWHVSHRAVSARC